MSAYLLIMNKVLRTEGWEAYQHKVVEHFTRYGGKYVAMRQTPEVLDGAFNCDRITMVEFPSKEIVRAMWNSPEYTEIRKLREGLGLIDVCVIESV